jgi:mono/diheme cytochrome c family protein
MIWWLYVWSVQADVPKKLPPPKERGEILYKDLCWQCHGEQGRGDGPLSKSIKSGIPVISGTSTAKEKDRIDIIQYGNGVMPAYEQLIDRHDSRRILLWLKDPVPQKKEEKEKEKPKKKKKDVQ